MRQSFYEEAVFELQFWLQILGDHSRFLHDALAPDQRQYIQQANEFIQRFDQLLSQSRQSLNEQQLHSLLQDAKTSGELLRKYKLTIIKEKLIGKIKIAFSPSFLNHMVNELEEFLRILSYLVKGERLPQFHPLHHDLLWLLDAAGHAGAINDRLDRVEKKFKEYSHEFTKDWEDFYLKAVELAGYLRANVKQFPALTRFHHDVEVEMEVFKHFLRELEEMEMDKETLGALSPLMADHMAREECYYLIKLAETTEVVMPECDPTKPRTHE